MWLKVCVYHFTTDLPREYPDDITTRVGIFVTFRTFRTSFLHKRLTKYIHGIRCTPTS